MSTKNQKNKDVWTRELIAQNRVVIIEFIKRLETMKPENKMNGKFIADELNKMINEKESQLINN